MALASLLVHHKDPARAQAIALELRKALNEANSNRDCRVLGPAPAPFARLRGEHRIQFLIKSRSRKRLRQLIDTTLAAANFSSADLRSVNVEIDPVSMM